MSEWTNKSAPRGNGGGPREVPPAGKYRAAIVAVIALGTHMEKYKENAPKPKPKVYVVWELLGDKKRSDGSPFTVARDYTFSTSDLAGWRKLWAAHLGSIKKESDIVGQPIGRLLGTACRMKIEHNDNGEEGEARRVYADIAKDGGITELDEDAEVGKAQRTSHVPFLHPPGASAPYQDHDWVPYVYDRNAGRRVPVSEMIACSLEAKKAAPAAVAPPAEHADQFEV